MIKKGFAVFAALLLMGSNLNAYNYNCFVAADNLAAAYGKKYNWSHAEEHAAFVALYDTCVAAAQQ